MCSVRFVREDDHENWRRLWTSYLEFYETSVTEDVYAASFERLLSGRPGEYQGLIAEQEGRPVGLAHFLFHRNFWTIEDTCYLMDLFVDPDVRGGGIGRALIEAVSAEARKAGIPEVYWLTQEFNYKGRTLYDKVATKTPFIVYSKET